METIAIIPQAELNALRSQIDRIETAQFKIFANANSTEFFTPEETAKLLKISLKTLSNWRERSLISYFQIGANIRFSKEQIEEFVTRNSLKSSNKF